MTRKRRSFDIDLTEEPAPEATPRDPDRRGPMAAAVAETARSVRDRQAMETRIRAENDGLAQEFVRLKKEGLIVDRVAIDAISSTMLTRDRAQTQDPEIEELQKSIREIGLSNPIRVEEGEGGYELIQGYRRLMAFRALDAAHPGEGYDRIPAGIAPRGEGLEASYRRMVDENLVRKGVSFAEMGALARAYAADPGTDCASAEDAVAALFRSAGYQKRTYIRSFARLLELIGEALTHPDAISRNLGLAVLKRLEREADTAGALRAQLTKAKDAAGELAILSAYAAEEGGAPTSAPRKHRAKAKTTLRMEAAGRQVKCIAGGQRLELSGDTDFSAYDRDRLERAVAAFFAALEKG